MDYLRDTQIYQRFDRCIMSIVLDFAVSLIRRDISNAMR